MADDKPEPETSSSAESGAEAGAFDARASSLWHDIRTIAKFLTRLPMGDDAPGVEGIADASRAFPIVGAGIGLLGGVVYGVAAWLAVPPPVAALLAIGAMVLITGAMHEDGLADTADGFGGGLEANQKLRIMRDSRIGTYGALALILAIALRALPLAAIGVAGGGWTAMAVLIAAAAGSRGLLPAFLRAMPAARSDGMAASAGAPPRDAAMISLVLGALAVLLFLGPVDGVVAAAVGAAAAWAVVALGRSQIGGITGDVLGAAQQAGEAGILIAAAAMI